jgi:hypothetical protein
MGIAPLEGCFVVWLVRQETIWPLPYHKRPGTVQASPSLRCLRISTLTEVVVAVRSYEEALEQPAESRLIALALD